MIDASLHVGPWSIQFVESSLQEGVVILCLLSIYAAVLAATNNDGRTSCRAKTRHDTCRLRRLLVLGAILQTKRMSFLIQMLLSMRREISECTRPVYPWYGVRVGDRQIVAFGSTTREIHYCYEHSGIYCCCLLL